MMDCDLYGFHQIVLGFFRIIIRLLQDVFDFSSNFSRISLIFHQLLHDFFDFYDSIIFSDNLYRLQFQHTENRVSKGESLSCLHSSRHCFLRKTYLTFMPVWNIKSPMWITRNGTAGWDTDKQISMLSRHILKRLIFLA